MIDLSALLIEGIKLQNEVNYKNEVIRKNTSCNGKGVMPGRIVSVGLRGGLKKSSGLIKRK